VESARVVPQGHGHDAGGKQSSVCSRQSAVVRQSAVGSLSEETARPGSRLTEAVCQLAPFEIETCQVFAQSVDVVGDFLLLAGAIE